MITGTNNKTSVVDYVRQISNRLGYVGVCHYKYFRYNNKLNTSCIPQYYCDDLSISDWFLVQQILHYPAFKGHAHVAVEASSHVLDQNI